MERCACWVCRESVPGRMAPCERGCQVLVNTLDCQRHNLSGMLGSRWCAPNPRPLASHYREESFVASSGRDDEGLI